MTNPQARGGSANPNGHGDRAEADRAIFERVVRQAPDAMILSDRDGTIRLWNRAAETVFGYAADEALGASLDLIVPPRLRDSHWRGYRAAIDSGTLKYAGRVMRTRAQHRDGSRVYVDLSFGLLRDEDGAIEGVLAIARDCTAAHLAGKMAAAGTGGEAPAATSATSSAIPGATSDAPARDERNGG